VRVGDRDPLVPEVVGGALSGRSPGSRRGAGAPGAGSAARLPARTGSGQWRAASSPAVSPLTVAGTAPGSARAAPHRIPFSSAP